MLIAGTSAAEKRKYNDAKTYVGTKIRNNVGNQAAGNSILFSGEDEWETVRTFFLGHFCFASKAHGDVNSEPPMCCKAYSTDMPKFYRLYKASSYLCIEAYKGSDDFRSRIRRLVSFSELLSDLIHCHCCVLDGLELLEFIYLNDIDTSEKWLKDENFESYYRKVLDYEMVAPNPWNFSEAVFSKISELLTLHVNLLTVH